MSLAIFLQAKPDVDLFWSTVAGKRGETAGQILEASGYSKDDINTVEDLINIKIIAKALSGDLQAKRYIDEKLSADRRAECLRVKNNL